MDKEPILTNFIKHVKKILVSMIKDDQNCHLILKRDVLTSATPIQSILEINGTPKKPEDQII